MRFLRNGLAGLFCLAGLASAVAQDPAAPKGAINFVVPLAAGGPIDSVARIVGDFASRSLGRQVVVVNMPGAGGNIGAAFVARAAPDGLTWLLTFDTVFTVNPHLYKDMGFNPDRDLVPVASLAQSPLVLAVNAKTVSATSLSELIAGSRAKPVSFASAGVGSPAHLAYEYLRMASELQAVHVPYRGAAPALQDMVAGAVDAGFIGVAPVLPLIKSGALRPLTVSTDARIAALPDVPSAEEAGIRGFDANFKFLLLAQPGVPDAARDGFAQAVRTAVADPKVMQLLQNLSVEPKFEEGPAIAQWIVSARRKWGAVVSAAGMRESN